MLFTICTPTYNRAHLLSRLHTSLLNNADEHCKIEWLVIDDGSSDNTEDLVRSFCENAALKIRYIKKENQGKHSCLNIGFKEANGELFHILDSDDMLAEGALKTVLDTWSSIREDNYYAGIIGICKDMNTMENLGEIFPKSPMTAKLLELRYKLNMRVDHSDFIRTSLLKNQAYPIIQGERFVPEVYVMGMFDVSHGYLCINSPLKLVEYQTSGISNNYVSLASKNSIGTTMALQAVIENKSLMMIIGAKGRIRHLSNYFRYWLHNKSRRSVFVPALRFFPEYLISIVIGGILFIRDSI